MPVNPNIDERRYDVPMREALTPGEARLIRYSVREKQTDGSFLPAANFGAYTEWEFYCLEKLGSAGIDQASRRSGSLFYLTGASINVGTPPYAVVSLDTPDTVLIGAKVGMRAHELWAKVSGSWTRLSYGDLPFVD